MHDQQFFLGKLVQNFDLKKLGGISILLQILTKFSPNFGHTPKRYVIGF
jgi:hypothetical protein